MKQIGEPKGVLTLTVSKAGIHCSPIAPHRLRTLAKIIGNLPAELRAFFELELAVVPRSEPATVREMKYFRA